MTAALLMSASIRGSFAAISAAVRTLSKSPRSSGNQTRSAFGVIRLIRAMASLFRGLAGCGRVDADVGQVEETVSVWKAILSGAASPARKLNASPSSACGQRDACLLGRAARPLVEGAKERVRVVESEQETD